MSLPVPVSSPQVPPKLRFVLYWLSWGISSLAALVSGVWQLIAAASPDITSPLWVRLAAPVLLLVVAQLNALAGANVSPTTRLSAGGYTPRRNQRGTVSRRVVIFVVVFVLVVLLLAWLSGSMFCTGKGC